MDAGSLEKIKQMLGARSEYEIVKRVGEANAYSSYSKMAIDDKKAVSIVQGSSYTLGDENEMWVNTKLRCGYMSRIVRQRVNYAFGRACSFTMHSEAMERLFDMLTIRRCGWYITLHGKGYLEAIFNEEGKMSGIRAHDPAHCFEFMDRDKEGVRAFIIIEDLTDEFGMPNDELVGVRIIEDLETTFQITNYEYNGSELTELNKSIRVDKINSELISKFNGDIVLELYEDPFKVGVFTEIKSLVDEYDTLCSESSDYLKKTPRSPIVVHGYNTSMSELVTNMVMYNVIPTTEDGNVSVLESHQDVSAIEKQLNRVEDAIREQSGWVKAELGLISYSGTALRMKYAEIDIHSQHLQATMVEAFKAFLPYMVTTLQALGLQVDFNPVETMVDADGDGKLDLPINIMFDSDVMVNETDSITNCVNSATVISMRTTIENHPWVKDVDQELRRLEEEGRSIYNMGYDLSDDGESGDSNVGAVADEHGNWNAQGESEGKLNPNENGNLTNNQRSQLKDSKEELSQSSEA